MFSHFTLDVTDGKFSYANDFSFNKYNKQLKLDSTHFNWVFMIDGQLMPIELLHHSSFSEEEQVVCSGLFFDFYENSDFFIDVFLSSNQIKEISGGLIYNEMEECLLKQKKKKFLMELKHWLLNSSFSNLSEIQKVKKEDLLDSFIVKSFDWGTVQLNLNPEKDYLFSFSIVYN